MRQADDKGAVHRPAQVADPLIGQVVEGFEIQSAIGQGSMGDVYRAVHSVIGKPVAIKVLKWELAQDAEMAQRLIREARAVNAIKHPGIVDVFGCGTLPSTQQPFIIMDLLEGESLEAFLTRAAPLPLKTMFVILDELLSALAAAHSAGVIHRDLKPGNIFLERQEEGRQRAKLLDFGLARQAQASGGSIDPTRPGVLMGTPAFMAPEQILGEKVGPHTDLYAVGGIAYQMATGHLPHEGESSIEILSLKLRADPPRPAQWNSQLSEALDQWIIDLLNRDPERRPRSAEVVRQQLAAIRDARRQPTGAMPAMSLPVDDVAGEPQTLLHQLSGPNDPASSQVTDEKELALAGGSGTQLLWGAAAAHAPVSRETPFNPEDDESAPLPIALFVALSISLVAICAGLWWLFNR